jgi:hypothetical protein
LDEFVEFAGGGFEGGVAGDRCVVADVLGLLR